MPQIIEFVGIPCCGKSTLAHKLAKEIEKKDVLTNVNIHILIVHPK